MSRPAINQRFMLEPRSLKVNETRLEIFCIKNLDPFIRQLEEKGDAYVPEFPFWVKVWEASLVLLDYLANRDLGKNRRILEIGAGMGVVGLFLGSLGHRVTITDNNPDALELAEYNVRHNGLETVDVQYLDWNQPQFDEKFDIVCGAELLYNESAVEPVLAICRGLLETKGTAYLAHNRMRRFLPPFALLASETFNVKTVDKILTGKDVAQKVILHILSTRNS